MRFFIGCLLSAVLGSTVTIWLLTGTRENDLTAQERRLRIESPVERVRPGTTRIFDEDGLTPDESIAVAVYEAVNRSVVNITAKSVRTERLILTEHSEGSGSGAIIDHDGHILTNFHVVNGAKEIGVTLYNGKTYEATMIGADQLNDLAVIQIESTDDELFPVALGDSRGLRVGMRVFALGNPFGLERTLTTGGPLLDAHGRLIGINTAIATTSGQSSGVGFAIPVSLVSRVIPQLLKYGRVIRPESGIDKVYQTDKGLLIAEMRPNGAAERAGLRGPKMTKTRRGPFTVNREDRSAADLIVAVDEQKIATAEDFLSYIEGKRPGDEVVLTVVREGRRIQIPLTLATSEAIERLEQ